MNETEVVRGSFFLLVPTIIIALTAQIDNCFDAFDACVQVAVRINLQ